MLQKCTDKWVSSKKLSVQCTSSGLTASRLLPEAKHLHGSTSRVGGAYDTTPPLQSREHPVLFPTSSSEWKQSEL